MSSVETQVEEKFSKTLSHYERYKAQITAGVYKYLKDNPEYKKNYDKAYHARPDLKEKRALTMRRYRAKLKLKNEENMKKLQNA